MEPQQIGEGAAPNADKAIGLGLQIMTGLAVILGVIAYQTMKMVIHAMLSIGSVGMNQQNQGFVGTTVQQEPSQPLSFLEDLPLLLILLFVAMFVAATAMKAGKRWGFTFAIVLGLPACAINSAGALFGVVLVTYSVARLNGYLGPTPR